MIAELKGVGKEYQVGDQTIIALQPLDLSVNTGELTLIIGPSGSGKTTLLSLLGCVIYPTQGKLFVNEQLVNEMNQKQLAHLRLNTIGFVFQSFNLIAPLNALDNVMIPLQLKKINSKDAKIKAEAALNLVGMLDRKKSLPKQLSGGQQQRVAIARALVSQPTLLLADEPTGNLDTQSGVDVMHLLEQLNTDHGVAVILVTHDHEVAARARRRIRIRDGLIESDDGAHSVADQSVAP